MNQILEFCAYFTLVKNSTELVSVPIGCKQKPKSEKPKHGNEKVPRKKFQVVEHKPQPKTVKTKPKMEQPPRSNKKSLSPVEFHEPTSTHDLNYFISHISGHHPYPHTRGEESQLYLPLTKFTDSKSNYETFGRTGYETYGESRENSNRYVKGSNTDRPPQLRSNMPLFTSKLQSNSKFDFGFNFFPTNQNYKPWQRPAYDRKPNTPYQQFQTPRQAGIMYSPIRRDSNAFGNSAVIKNYSPDHSLSKSRAKNQRKNSEKPFYDPSKLTPPRKQPEQSSLGLSKSFVDMELSANSHMKKSTEAQRREISTTSFPKKYNDDERRQTSVTTPAPKQSNQSTVNRQQINREIDLDDESEEYITNILEQRRAPTAIEVDMRGSNC